MEPTEPHLSTPDTAPTPVREEPTVEARLVRWLWLGCGTTIAVLLVAFLALGVVIWRGLNK